tara:strand:+ start:3194 stop:4078 length:885 start_codon:yes stop_codon:yes gene_type:complete
MRNPGVSIIIPTYKRAGIINKAINSVLEQTHSNWELIIVDNFSNDGTKELISKLNDKRIKFFEIKNNGVIGKSRNFGIKNSNFSIIAFLDSDDYWLSNKLEESLNYIEKGYDLVYHDLFILKNNRKSICKKKLGSFKIEKPVFYNLIKLGNPIACSSVVVKANLLNETKGFSENIELITSEDYDLWIRISRLTNKFKFIDKTLGFYKIDDNESGNPELSYRSLRAIYNIHLKENIKTLPVWFLYMKARYLYQLNENKDSFLILKSLLITKTSIQIKIKTFYMFFSLLFKLNKIS